MVGFQQPEAPFLALHYVQLLSQEDNCNRFKGKLLGEVEYVREGAVVVAAGKGIYLALDGVHDSIDIVDVAKGGLNNKRDRNVNNLDLTEFKGDHGVDVVWAGRLNNKEKCQ